MQAAMCLYMQVLWRQPIGAVAGGPDSTVTALSYSLELEGLCIGLSTGELLFLNTESCQLEEVGSIEGGIVALQWSPDGEVFAAVSGVGQLLLMNQVGGCRPHTQSP
jgi:elongator complex protein 1